VARTRSWWRRSSARRTRSRARPRWSAWPTTDRRRMPWRCSSSCAGARAPTGELVDVLLRAVDELRDHPAVLGAEDREDQAARLLEDLAAAATPVRALLAEPALAQPPGRRAGLAPAVAPPPAVALPWAMPAGAAAGPMGGTIKGVGRAAGPARPPGRRGGDRAPARREPARRAPGGRGGQRAGVPRPLHVLGELQEKAMQARTVPFVTIVEPLRHAARDLAARGGRQAAHRQRARLGGGGDHGRRRPRHRPRAGARVGPAPRVSTPAA
jgi:hypothetical protein